MVGKLVSILTLIGFVFATFFWLDSNYAKCADVQMVQASVEGVGRRLDLKIQGDNLDRTQARLWSLEDRYGADPDRVQDPHIKQQMKELKSQIPILEDKVKKLGK
jgi:hypothetical protein